MTLICHIDDLADGCSGGFTARIGSTEKRLIAVRKGNDIFVYINSCPHLGLPLDIVDGQFLDLDKTHIQCANHGAIFNIEDGLCIHGPCAGGRLKQLKTKVHDGNVYIL